MSVRRIPLLFLLASPGCPTIHDIGSARHRPEFRPRSRVRPRASSAVTVKSSCSEAIGSATSATMGESLATGESEKEDRANNSVESDDSGREGSGETLSGSKAAIGSGMVESKSVLEDPSDMDDSTVLLSELPPPPASEGANIFRTTGNCIVLIAMLAASVATTRNGIPNRGTVFSLPLEPVGMTTRHMRIHQKTGCRSSCRP